MRVADQRDPREVPIQKKRGSVRLSSALGSQWSVFDSHAREVFDLGEDRGVDFRLRLAERRRHGAGSYSLGFSRSSSSPLHHAPQAGANCGRCWYSFCTGVVPKLDPHVRRDHMRCFCKQMHPSLGRVALVDFP